MNILFVGNSYTYFNDLPQLFQDLARANGKQLNTFSVTKGGRRLDAYMDPSDETTHQLERLIRERHYDVCFLQEQSTLPALDYTAFLSGVQHVLQMAKGCADKFCLYATWGRKAGSPDLETHGWTPESMTDLLAKSYQKAGQHFGATVSHVGQCFWHIKSRHPHIELHNPDLTHPSYQGSCLAALMHYQTLFGNFPENTQVLGLQPEVLEAFRSAVRAVSESSQHRIDGET